MKNVRVMCAVAAAMILAFGGQAVATDRLVPSQYATIRAAIDAAVDGDTVVVLPGTYSTSGSLYFSFLGKAITVRSTDPDDPAVVAATIINANAGNVGFISGEGPGSVLAGLSIKGILATSSPPYGDAILCSNSSPRIEKCVISGVYGGTTSYAIGLANSNAVFSQCTFSGGSGTVYVSGGSPVFDRCIFSGTTALETIGAAVKNVGGNVLMRNCYLTKNVGAASTYNWAIHTASGGAVTLQGCTLNRNGKLVADTAGCLNIFNTIIMPGGDSNRIRLMGGSTANVEYCAVTGLTANSLIDAGCVLNWGDGNFDPGAMQPIGSGGQIEPGSIFMNAGDPNYVVLPDETDIKGNPRISGPRIDIGCYEIPLQAIVTVPVAGEILAAGSSRDIVWKSVAGQVDLYFSDDGGASWQVIQSGLSGVGRYSWTVPAIESSECIVAAECAGGGTVVRGASGQFTIRPYTAGSIAGPVWPSIGGGYGRRGLSGSNGPQTGCLKAAFRTPGAVHTGIAIGWQGRIYVGCDDGTLLMYLSSMEAKPSSRIALDSPITGSPSIGPDGTVYVGCKNGKLFALDQFAVVKWTFTTGGMITGSPAVAPDGRVFVGSTDGVLYALSADGSNLWQYSLATGSRVENAFFASPTVGLDGSVYAADAYNPVLYALDPDTGAVRWQADFRLERASGSVPVVLGRLVAAPAVGPDGTIYVMFEGYPKLYAINHTNGARKWSKDMADTTSGLFEGYVVGTARKYFINASAWSEPVVGPDGTIYVSMDDPYIRAVNPDGTMQWVRKCAFAGSFTLTVGADGLIYACSDDKYMYVLDPSGKMLSMFKGEGWLSYPVVGADGRVHVSDSAGVVWVIGAGHPSGQELALWRMWDANKSGDLNLVDYALMAQGWKKTTWDYRVLYASTSPMIVTTTDFLQGDFNRDAYVDFQDMMVMAEDWLSE